MRSGLLLLFYLIVHLSVNGQATIYFEFDSSKLDSKARMVIDSMLDSDPLSLDVSCHCDQPGSDSYNLELSQRRALAVKTYLIRQGTDPSHISLSFFGESRPLFEETSVNRYRNRRCEIRTPARKQSAEVKGFFQNLEAEVGKTYPLPGLEFIGNQVIPEAYSLNTLEYLLSFLRANPHTNISIEGHVCCHNDVELSKDRAFMVYDFLVGHGISGKRLSYKGYGNKRPLVDEIDEASEKKNRRVEIRILRTGKAPKAQPNLIPERVDEFFYPISGVEFFPNRDYLYPHSKTNLEMIAKSIRENPGFHYTFLLYEQRNREKVLEKRVEEIRTTLRKLGVSKDVITILPADENAPDVARGRDFMLLTITLQNHPST